MSSANRTCRVDQLGRMVLPINIRKSLDINVDDELDIYTEKGKIILKKHKPSCTFCGKTSNLSEFKNKFICSNCENKIKNS